MRLIDEKGNDRDFHFEVSKYAGHLWKSHVARHLAIYDLFKETVPLPGAMAEFGVHNGSTYFFLARLLEIFHPDQHETHHVSSHALYGFDTFSGLAGVSPEDAAVEDHPQKRDGGLAGSFEAFSETLEAMDCAVRQRLHVIKGDVRETFPRFLEQEPGVRFKFVLLDMDIWAPTKAVLDVIGDVMVPNGLIVFDEYANPQWPGETKAADEFVSRHGLDLHAVPRAFAPAAYVRWPAGRGGRRGAMGKRPRRGKGLGS